MNEQSTQPEPVMFEIDLVNKTECAIAADHLLTPDGKMQLIYQYRGARRSQS